MLVSWKGFYFSFGSCKHSFLSLHHPRQIGKPNSHKKCKKSKRGRRSAPKIKKSTTQNVDNFKIRRGGGPDFHAFPKFKWLKLYGWDSGTYIWLICDWYSPNISLTYMIEEGLKKKIGIFWHPLRTRTQAEKGLLNQKLKKISVS